VVLFIVDQDVFISILPTHMSEGMFSWFPIFFPLMEPITIKQGDTIRGHFWRLDDAHKVWYEWCVSSPQPSPLHNPGGRSYFIGK